MNIQVGLRLHEDNVAYLDAEVAAGHIKSRAAYVDRLLARDRRRKRSLEDLPKLQDLNTDPELTGIAAWTAAHPVDMSDLD